MKTILTLACLWVCTLHSYSQNFTMGKSYKELLEERGFLSHEKVPLRDIVFTPQSLKENIPLNRIQQITADDGIQVVKQLEMGKNLLMNVMNPQKDLPAVIKIQSNRFIVMNWDNDKTRWKVDCCDSSKFQRNNGMTIFMVAVEK